MTAEASTSNPVLEWSRPASRSEHIEQLISGVDRYNPQNITVLTEYLEQQLQTGEYDCLANLAILKLFQFNPQDFDYSIVISVLLKALTAAPFHDFNLCLSLLGEAPVSTLPAIIQPNLPEDATEEQKVAAQRQASEAANQPSAGILTDPIIVKLSTLSSHLLSAQFRLFWKTLASQEYADVREYIKNVHTFDDAVRAVVLDSVKGAFRTISAQRLAEYLNFGNHNSGELQKYLAQHQGWHLDTSSGKVAVPANPDNDVKATVIREDVQLDQLTRLLSQAQTPILTT